MLMALIFKNSIYDRILLNVVLCGTQSIRLAFGMKCLPQTPQLLICLGHTCIYSGEEKCVFKNQQSAIYDNLAACFFSCVLKSVALVEILEVLPYLANQLDLSVCHSRYCRHWQIIFSIERLLRAERPSDYLHQNQSKKLRIQQGNFFIFQEKRTFNGKQLIRVLLKA